MNTFIDIIRRFLRSIVRSIAPILNKLSGGHLTPGMITITGLLAHIPIAWLIATRHNLWAAGLLVIFGLFDALDGELARLQGSATKFGMFLDSVTDRMKEVFLYTGAAYAVVATGHAYQAVWVVLACGTAILVSYTNAWGEATTAGHTAQNHQKNKTFRSGIMSFDVRISVLVLGLLANHLFVAVVIITVGAWVTAFGRLLNVREKLKNAED